MNLVWIVIVSCVIQFIAAALALRLIPLTKKRLAWSLVSLALFLMAIRRMISIYVMLTSTPVKALDPSQEYIALLISILMVFGIAAIRPIFAELQAIEKDTRRNAQELALLNHLNAAVNSGETLDKVVNLLTTETRKIFGTIGTTIYLLNEERDYLVMTHKPDRFMKEIGLEKLKKHIKKDVRIRLTEDSIYREILDSGKKRVINDQTVIRQMMEECTEDPVLKELVPLVYKALPIASVASIPLIHEGMCIGLMDSSRKTPFSRDELDRLAVLGQQITVILRRYQIEKELFHRAMYDSLTDVANRLVMDDALRRAVAVARRNVTSVLIFLDADYFKQVNDNLGHIAGDRVLRNIAQQIKASLRGEDILARVGGDEFAILMEDSTEDDGMATIERIQKAVSEIKVQFDSGEMAMSCSCGLVLIDGTLDPDRLLAAADHKMYDSKNKKFNREQQLLRLTPD